MAEAIIIIVLLNALLVYLIVYWIKHRLYNCSDNIKKRKKSDNENDDIWWSMS